MRILAVDTAAEGCSAAVSVDGFIVAELSMVLRSSHSRRVLETIDTLLSLAGMVPASLNALAVTIGPGAFTGLRIGLAAVKGLAAALDLPVACVSTLEVLAVQAGLFSGSICPVLDARRGEVYFSRFSWHDGELRCEQAAQVAIPERAFAVAAEASLFIGSGARRYHDLIAERLGSKAHFVPAWADTLRAAVVAALGQRQLSKGLGVKASAVLPTYLRAADAVRPTASQTLFRTVIDKGRGI